MCEFSDAFSSAFAICVTADVDPHPIRRVIITEHRRSVRARVASEIIVISDLRPRVEERRVLVPSRVKSLFDLDVVGSAKASAWHRLVVASDVDLEVVGTIRGSIDNEAEVVGLALGVSAEIALELV